MSISLSFDPEHHKYKLNGRSVPSVTQIIEQTIGSGFEFLSKAQAEFAKQRGRAVHACAEYVAKGVDFKYDARIDGYVSALHEFFKLLNQKDIYGVEVQLGSRQYHFAGTLDLHTKIMGRHSLVDWKNSMDEKRLALQLGGYSILAKENGLGDVTRGYGVKLNDDGTYQMTPPIDLKAARRDFLVLRSYISIRNRVQT